MCPRPHHRKWQGWGSHPALYDSQESKILKPSWTKLGPEETVLTPPSCLFPLQGRGLSYISLATTGPYPLFFLPKPPQKALSLFICHFIWHRQAGISERNFISFLAFPQLCSEENRNCKNMDKFSDCRFLILRIPSNQDGLALLTGTMPGFPYSQLQAPPAGQRLVSHPWQRFT